MTYTKYKQILNAKESKQDDLYSLFAIFTVSLQEKYLYGSNGKKRTHGNSSANG